MKPLSDPFYILRVPAFWRFQLVFWSFGVLLQFLLVGLMGDQTNMFLTPRLIVVRLMTGVILSSLGAVILAWLDALRLSTVKFTMATLALILIFFSIATLVGYRVYHQINHQGPPKEILLALLILRLGIYSFWTFFFLRFITQIRRNQLLEENRHAELALLRNQVNPHFLFNALATIMAVRREEEKVVLVTQSLADYLRFSLSQHQENKKTFLYPLGEELEALRNYLEVENVRFGENLIWNFDIEEDAEGFGVPSALVQPLLENAIKYGQLTSPKPLIITVTARVQAGKLFLCVENTGSWHARVEPSVSLGSGISNLKKRLALIFRGSANLSFENSGDRVRAHLVIPSEIP